MILSGCCSRLDRPVQHVVEDPGRLGSEIEVVNLRTGFGKEPIRRWGRVIGRWKPSGVFRSVRHVAPGPPTRLDDVVSTEYQNGLAFTQLGMA